MAQDSSALMFKVEPDAPEKQETLDDEARSSRKFGEIGVELGYCSNTDIKDALETQAQLEVLKVPDRIGNILIKKKVLTTEQVRTILKEQHGRPKLAGFEIIEKIGQGGMGAVFKARQITMDRIVALKILIPDLARNPIFKERFLREARLCGKLNHMNVVNAIECGETAGYVYFAMEYLEGSTCRELLKEQGRLPLDLVFKIAHQICDGLAYAHAKNFVHRDIKPDNIMINKSGVAKLLDLGLARSISKDDDCNLTLANRAVGTPHYISPEQARGVGDIDQRADIYGLGATLYHLITGKTLFSGQNANQVMTAHLTQCAPALTALCPEAPDALGIVVSKMLAKDRNDRYGSVEEVRKDLNAVIEGVLPQAGNFKAVSSCAMPAFRKVDPRNFVRGTTGPRSPIHSRGTTGPRTPIASKATTGPRNPVKGTAPVEAIRATRQGIVTARSTSKRSSLTSILAACGLAIVLGLSIAVFSNKPRPVSDSSATPRDIISKVDPAPKVSTKPEKKVDRSPQAAPLSDNERSAHVPLAALQEASEALSPVNQSKQHKNAEANPVEAIELAASKVEIEPAIDHIEVSVKQQETAVSTDQTEWLLKVLESVRNDGISKAMHALEERIRKVNGNERDFLRQELKSLGEALSFEREALQGYARNNPVFELPGELVRSLKLTETTAKVVGYEPSRGLIAELKDGIQLPIPAERFDAEKLVAQLPERNEVAAFLYYRGAYKSARSAAAQLPLPQREALLQKIDALSVVESEQSAQAAWNKLNLQRRELTQRDFAIALNAFRKTHGETRFFAGLEPEFSNLLTAAEKSASTASSVMQRLNAAKIELLDNGFIALQYDFSNERQLKDFTTDKGTLVISRGALKCEDVKSGSIAFTAPFTEIREFGIVARNSQLKTIRLAIHFIEANKRSKEAPSVLIGYKKSELNGTLTNWTKNEEELVRSMKPVSEIGLFMQRIGSKFAWTIGGEKYPALDELKFSKPVQLKLTGRGETEWKSLKLIIKPDLDWLAQDLSK